MSRREKKDNRGEHEDHDSYEGKRRRRTGKKKGTVEVGQVRRREWKYIWEGVRRKDENKESWRKGKRTVEREERKGQVKLREKKDI